MDFGV